MAAYRPHHGWRLRRGAGRVQTRIASKSDQELLLRSGLIDAHWVGLQLDTTFSDTRSAVEAYLLNEVGSPHPLILPAWIDRKFGEPDIGTDPLVWYLTNSRVRRRASTHPLVDPRQIRLRYPEYALADFGPVSAWLKGATDDTPLPAPEGHPTLAWGRFRELAYQAAIEWMDSARLRDALRLQTTEPVQEPTSPAAPPPSRPGEPLVSIVMPMFNRAPVVRQAIESVQAQSWHDWELIVVDDGSDDDGLAVVRGMANFDARIICVAAEHRGVSAARNAALRLARAPYVAFLDTDNTWRPDFLRVMLTELHHNGWEMGHSALRAQRDGEVYFRASEGSHAHLLAGGYIDLNVLVVCKSAIDGVGGFDESLKRGVDYDLVLKLAARWQPHLISYIGSDYNDDEESAQRISTTESPAWLSVIASRHLADAHGPSQPRQSGLTSVVLPTESSLRATLRWVNLLAGCEDIELVLVGSRLRFWQHAALSAVASASDNVRLVHLEARRGTTTSLNVGVVQSKGDRVVLVAGAVLPDVDALKKLAATLDDPTIAIAQPVIVNPDGEIETAGAVFGATTSRPDVYLHRHSLDDLPHEQVVELPAALSSVIAVRTQAFRELGGLDALYGEALAGTALSMRIRSSGSGRTVLRTDARLTSFTTALPSPADRQGLVDTLDHSFHRPPPGSAAVWSAAGFELLGHRLEPLEPWEPLEEAEDPAASVEHSDQPVLWPRSVVRPVSRYLISETAPSLRWTIDLASPAGQQGRSWGDTHFGQAFADALRSLGQRVCVDPREARHRPTRDYDDVIMTIRGLDRVSPRPESINVEWVISHPDLVTADEVAGFDLVYAASRQWALERSQTWKLDIRTLLQATDPALFHPDRATFDTGDEVLFVGNSRGVLRSSLRDAMSVGANVTVHGQGWAGILPHEAVSSRFVENADLGYLYAAAGIVLNDHWEDMRIAGFVSNRLMDAAACGARIISDPLPGVDLQAMFFGLVQVYENEADMARLLRGHDTNFPIGDDRVIAAQRVGVEHSFHARARTVRDDVVKVWLKGADDRST